jgi:hypothetical protein
MSEIKIVFPELHPQMAHLSWDEIEQVQQAYMANELKVGQILKQFNLLDITPSAIKSRIPALIDKDIACPICNVFAHRKIEDRYGCLSLPFCPTCGEQLMNYFSPEERMRTLKREKENQSRQQTSVSKDGIPKVAVKLSEEIFNTLTFEQKVFVGCWVKSSANEELTTVDMLDVICKKICPTNSWYEALLVEVTQAGLIPNEWIVKILFELETNFAQYLFNPKDRLGGTEEEILEFWNKMAYYECIDYYTYRMNDVRFSVKVGEKTEVVFKKLLQDYSTSQIWSLIFKEVQNSCEFFTRGEANRIHAGNTVIGNIERRADRYRLSGYTIYPYNRSLKYAVQSEMSHYFFDTLLGIGDAGFKQRPSPEFISSIIQD